MLIIYPSLQTTDGVWIGGDPVVRLSSNDTHPAKGRAIREALSRSRRNVPHPKSWANHMDPLLNAGGVKNWPTFVKGAKGLSIEEDGECITFSPLENLGAKDGLVPILGHDLSLPAEASDESLGDALERVLAVAR